MDKGIILIKLDSENILAYKVRLLKSFHFHPQLHRCTREKGLLEETIKLTLKNKTILYLLKKDDIMLGVIAMSASSIDEMPVIQIDYLFVDFKYRKTIIKDINSTISQYLIVFAIKTAEEVKKTIGIKYLALYPDAQSKKLISHYQKMGFSILNKHWLILKIA